MLMYQKENIKTQFPKLYRNNLILSAFSLIQQKESELLKMMVNKPEIIKYKGFNMAAKLDQYQTSPLSLYLQCNKHPLDGKWCKKDLFSQTFNF